MTRRSEEAEGAALHKVPRRDIFGVFLEPNGGGRDGQGPDCRDMERTLSFIPAAVGSH